MGEEAGGIRSRGEEVIGELAQSLLENPLFSQALGKALGAGERAAGAQRAALNALDVPSAGDLQRLSRRVRPSRTASRRSRTRSTGCGATARPDPQTGTTRTTRATGEPNCRGDDGARNPAGWPSTRGRDSAERGDGGVGEPQQRRVEWVVVQRPAVEAADDDRDRRGDALAPAQRQHRRRLQVPEIALLLAGCRGCLRGRARRSRRRCGCSRPGRRLRRSGRRSGRGREPAPPRGPRRASGWPRRPAIAASITRAEPSAGPSPVAAQVPIRIRRRTPSSMDSASTATALGPPIPVAWTVSGSPASVSPW